MSARWSGLALASAFLGLAAGAAVAGTRPASGAADSRQGRPSVLQFLALGDSYTIGEGVAAAERWPSLLVAHLKERGVEFADPEIVATTGWTTDELEKGIDAAHPALAPYDLVSLLIGVNNQYRGRSADDYRKEFRALLARAIGFAGGRPERVIVLSIPDWGKTPFAEGKDRAEIERAIAAFNSVNRDEARARGARYVFVTDETPLAPGSALLVADGLHLSGREYARWAMLVLPEALAALEHAAAAAH